MIGKVGTVGVFLEWITDWHYGVKSCARGFASSYTVIIIILLTYSPLPLFLRNIIAITATAELLS